MIHSRKDRASTIDLTGLGRPTAQVARCGQGRSRRCAAGQFNLRRRTINPEWTAQSDKVRHGNGAYGVSSFIGQGRGAGSLTICKAKHEIWNSGWSQADRATKRAAGIDRVLAEPKSKGGLYEITPANQGPKLIQEGGP